MPFLHPSVTLLTFHPHKSRLTSLSAIRNPNIAFCPTNLQIHYTVAGQLSLQLLLMPKSILCANAGPTIGKDLCNLEWRFCLNYCPSTGRSLSALVTRLSQMHGSSDHTNLFPVTCPSCSVPNDTCPSVACLLILPLASR